MELEPNGDIEEKAWAKPNDYKVDLSLLIKRLEEKKDLVKKVRYAKSLDIELKDELPNDWETIDVEEFKNGE